jgi:hypothetical protein
MSEREPDRTLAGQTIALAFGGPLARRSRRFRSADAAQPPRNSSRAART